MFRDGGVAITSVTNPSIGSRVPGVEGLRAVAALSILVMHSWAFSAPDDRAPSLGFLTRFMPDLAFGVTVFFTLSGFLLYRPFVAALLDGKRRPRVRAYLRNRALRIVPTYWAILLVSGVLLGTLLVWNDDGSLGTGGLETATFLKQALLLQHYSPETVVTGIGPAWSLAVEVVFYVALPLLAALAFALARPATGRSMRLLAALAPAALLLVLGLCGKAAAAYLVPPVTPFNGWEPDWHSVLERSFFAHADLFAFGMAVAVLSVEVGSGRIRFGRGARIAASGLAIGAYLVTARMTYVNEQLSYSPYNTLMALGCAALLALVVLPLPSGRTSPLARLLETRALVAAGIVSYSVFLWHYPLALWLKEQGLTVSGPSGFVVNVLVLAVATLALSVLTYRLVERPALRRKRPAEQPTPPALAAVPEPTL